MVQGHTASNWQTHMVYSEGPVFPGTVSKELYQKLLCPKDSTLLEFTIFPINFSHMLFIFLRTEITELSSSPDLDVPDPCHIAYA